ncbi:Leucine-rich repeat protein kinase family protein [Salix suchowensis]|nr:Leucine-rich repeat protein kinase family protein [Salix suchowensis]
MHGKAEAINQIHKQLSFLKLRYSPAASRCHVERFVATLVADRVTSNPIDQDALLALKDHIVDDPQNLLTNNWTTATSVCDWVGVTCGFRHRRVRALNLSHMGLSGTIPPHLGNLSFLVFTSFYNNSFRGSLPDELAKLRRLKYFSVRNNYFGGEIPSWFGSFTRLRALSLANNSFTGAIPPSLFRLSQLDGLDLSDNDLKGNIPREIGKLPNLPSSLFNNLPNLKALHLSRNQFHGQIPAALYGCIQLKILSLSYNNFEGKIHKDIKNLTALEWLYLGYNKFNGTIPPEIGNLVNLEIISLSNNTIGGPIPVRLFNISTLRTIQMTGNYLSGHLPSSIGLQLPYLERLIVGGNNFSGPIPVSLSNASELISLELSSNFFYGPIPDAFGDDLRNLRFLNLGGNNFTINSLSSELSFLTSLTNSKNLRTVILSFNPLKGTLPISVGNLSSSLESFVADNCQIKGSIPEGIGNLSNLALLSLQENDLKGTIPTTIGKLKKLQSLDFSVNNLEGSIPSDLCDVESLAFLYLGGNKLVGSIPSCLGNVSSLRDLSMGVNNLTSTIPSTLWRLKDIQQLELSSNYLSGSLPLDISNLKVVRYLDISGNQLSGEIPSSIGDLKDLAHLSLSNNRLQGPISPSFGGMVSLEFLDLSRNNLSGEIPKDMEKLIYLKYFNVSFNGLQGEIPGGGPFKKFSVMVPAFLLSTWPWIITFSAGSFWGNEALCGSPQMQVQPCKTRGRQRSKKASANVFKYILPAIGAVVIMAMAFTVLYVKCGRSNKKPKQADLPDLATWRRVSFLELERAINGFDEVNLLGRGSFGSVYKGLFLDGSNVAVKVFHSQLGGAFKSFDVECEVCCNIDFKALVLEFMPNWSLEKWLYSHNYFLDLLQRLNIMIDVAAALEYLHHGNAKPVVHCDLKPSNILLDRNMVAHVSDFGIAKLLGEDHSISQTLTLATVGYMAPEYGSEGIVSVKGDVYSYGILLMETFTGRRPTDEMFIGEMNLKLWVKDSLPGAVTQVADDRLKDHGQYPAAKKDCLSSILELALQCSAEQPEERIDIKDVLTTLKNIKAKFLKDSRGIET